MPLECVRKLSERLKQRGARHFTSGGYVLVRKPDIKKRNLRALVAEVMKERSGETGKSYRSHISEGAQFPEGSYNITFSQD